jgi:hypothetical protein
VGTRAGLDTENRGKILSPLPGIEPLTPGGPVARHYITFATRLTLFYSKVYISMKHEDSLLGYCAA